MLSYADRLAAMRETKIRHTLEKRTQNGYTDLVLIDEAFIKCAIEHELQRRERYATSAPIRRNDENP